jgi:DNA-binding PadR family transcriptional regulator
MKLINRILIVVLLFSAVASTSLLAEENGGPRTSQAYYKIQRGHEKEWVSLYTRYHYPLLKALKEKGYIRSITLLTRDRHHLSPDWDYELQIVWRDKVAQVTGLTPELQHATFPDWADFEKGEVARWQIVEAHWDEDLSPVKID